MSARSWWKIAQIGSIHSSMIDYFALLVALSFLLAVIGWVMFANSQRGRRQAAVLIWLAVPFLFGFFWYLYATFVVPPITLMKIYARFGFMAISGTTGIILIALSLAQRGKNGRED